MKRFILSFIFVLVATFTFAQPNPMHRTFGERFDFQKYEVVDSLPLERIDLQFNKEIDDENLIDLGNGHYMAPLPHKDKMIIRMTTDSTKAIVVYNSLIFGRHFEFNVKNNERRLILWYEDKGIYCGYIYDKYYKVCSYFESRKEFKRFMRRRFPTPPNFINRNKNE